MTKFIEILEVIGTVLLVSAGLGIAVSVAMTVAAAMQGVICGG